MRLTFLSDRYVLEDCTFEQRGVPKEARFRWDPTTKRWWTDDPVRAVRLLEYADETCRGCLEELRDQHAAALEASRATTADVAIPVPEGLTYLPYQRAGIAFGCARPNVLIGDEMGLGKTIQALGIINADDSIARVLIVCPASLKLNWEREARKWLVRPMTVSIADARTFRWTEVVILNFEILHRHSDLLRSVLWDCLIVDEAHRIKNEKARQAVEVYGGTYRDRVQTALPARRRVFLTGTPLVNRPRELFPLVHALDPVTWPKFWSFGQRYCDPQQVWTGKKHVTTFDGASHLDELQERLRTTIMVRRLKADVLTELPAKRRQVIVLPADTVAGAVAVERAAGEARREVLTALSAAVELAKASADPADYETAASALSDEVGAAFTEIAQLRHATALAKVPFVVEHVRDAISDGAHKVVVFAHHKDVIRVIAEAFDDAAVTLTGDTAMVARQAAVDRFQTDPRCQVFVGNLLAAGVGITLTAAAHVIFAELSFVPGDVCQAEDRCHRIGQRDSVLVQHLVLDGSLDALLVQTLIAKQQVIDQALDVESAAPLLTAPVAPVVERAATETLRRATIAAAAARLTPAQIEAIHQGLQYLAAVCDGADAKDGSGFAAVDVRIGHSLARASRLTAPQAVLGQRLVRKYRGQLLHRFGAELLAVALAAPSDTDAATTNPEGSEPWAAAS